MAMADWIVPSWTAPPNVRALMTTREGGVSEGSWGAAAGGGMNLGPGSGDDLEAVGANRRLLERHLPSPPVWLQQVHGVRVVDADAAHDEPLQADASFTTAPGRVCAVLVADCMPILFANRAGTCVAAAHAGWRGLAGGIVEATLKASRLDADDTVAWLGPAIGPTCFEVGADVRDAFVAGAGSRAEAVLAAFKPHTTGKWLADLPALARSRLSACGVDDVHASDLCTMSDARRFYSYRRDGVTGRMAASIWIAPPDADH